ncbi:NAD(P)/FAD-dependent oxidoreductase [Roseimaritima sediminicola]|uniref:NAD(P)/FAD-dependent oxidoreductase n=1 Tax=Roseimaritima sediminicola TaxID=2662066 RepID=UPI001386D419|nr:FAD-dependent oxidoreductase [Roseimaritima sediminicola]
MNAVETIPATASVQQAAQNVWDVIVVGAGLAGCAAALQLARRGHRVLLVDRAGFPREKVCGACLNGDALTALEQLGLSGRLRKIGGVRLDRFRLASGGRRLQLGLPEGLAIARSRLDSMLLRAAMEAGARFLAPVSVRIQPAEDDDRAACRSVRTADGKQTFSARTLVVATGLGSQVQVDQPPTRVAIDRHSRIGLGTQCRGVQTWYQPGTIYMAVGPEGYVGLSLVEQDTVNVAAAVDRAALQAASPEVVCESILKSSGMPVPQGWQTHPWQGTPALTRRRPLCASHRLFFVGDAQGYVEPFTGEGMAWALRGGRAVVDVVERGLESWHPELPQRWTATVQTLIRRRQRVCRALAWGLRHPRLVRTAMGVIQQCPALGDRVVRRLNQEVQV